MTQEINRATDREDELEGMISENSSAITIINNTISDITENLTENYYTKSETDDIVEGLFADAEYVSSAKTIEFYNKEGELLASIDATDFIKDGMVDNVEIGVPTGGTHSGETCLIITFNTDAGKESIEIPIDDIFDADNYYTKSEVDDLIESVDVSGQIAPLWSALTQEISDREDADSDIWDALHQEISARTEGDETLDGKIDDEIIRATSAETMLSEDIDTEAQRAQDEEERIWSALTKEIADREAEDLLIWSALTDGTGSISDITRRLEEEIERSTNEDELLWSALTQEINRATDREDELAEDIESENLRATSKENMIESALTQEIERSTNEDELLWSALTKEIADREAENEEIERVTAEALNDLNSRVNTNTSAITIINNTIDGIEQNIANNYYTKSQTDNIVDGLFSNAEYVSSAKTIVFYNTNNEAIDSIDATDFIKDGMVDNVVIDTPTGGTHSGETCLIITFNTDAGKESIEIPISDIFDSSLYYTKSEVDDLIESIDVSDQIAPLWSALTQEITDREDGDNEIWSALTQEITARTEGDEILDGKIDDEITRAQDEEEEIWSALTIMNEEIYQKIIDDEFVISSSLNDLNDRILELSAITETKQDELISGINIKTINNQSILGEGNITIQGGGGSGATYTAGNNIDITNDVISVTGISVPTSNTAFTNDANYVTSAYTDTNYYTKNQIDQMIGSIHGVFTKVTSAEYQAMYNAGTLDPDMLYVIVD